MRGTLAGRGDGVDESERRSEAGGWRAEVSCHYQYARSPPVFPDCFFRVADTPLLARVVPHLPPETLHRLIRHRGLDEWVLEGRTTSVSPTAFDFISTKARVDDVRAFMRRLPDLLSR